MFGLFQCGDGLVPIFLNELAKWGDIDFEPRGVSAVKAAEPKK